MMQTTCLDGLCHNRSLSETLSGKQQFEGFDVNEIADDAEIGYILEVDLEYPEELHDL